MSPTRREFLAASVAATACGVLSARAQDVEPAIIEDESKVPPYTLPDPLRTESGDPVRDADAWNRVRRPETLALFQEHVYGKPPGLKLNFDAKRVESSRSALDGAATRIQWEVHARAPADRDGSVLVGHLLLYTPNAARSPAPAVVALNFNGNHALSDDPAVPINPGWFRDNPQKGYSNNRATEASRGSDASRWPLRRIIDRGYALATMYYGDIDPDHHDGFRNGLHAFIDDPQWREGERPGNAWGSIGAWAVGLTAIHNVLAHASGANVDPNRIAVTGHSRLGKAALWAAAQDRRFALAISNQSGCGGAALSKRIYGETVGRINRAFPHWFCRNFTRYNENEAALPVDQHQLLALIAPRPVLVCSAEEDRWADPKGEFLACLHADPVYRLLGAEGLSAREIPGLNERINSALSYHIRPGQHDVTDADWQVYLDFMDKHLHTGA